MKTVHSKVDGKLSKLTEIKIFTAKQTKKRIFSLKETLHSTLKTTIYGGKIENIKKEGAVFLTRKELPLKQVTVNLAENLEFTAVKVKAKEGKAIMQIFKCLSH